MATVIETSWSSGTRGNKRAASCVGVAGSGLPSAYFGVKGTLQIRQNDDGSIDINETGLTIEQDEISNAANGGWGSDTWWFHGLYISKSSFTLYDGPSGPSGYGEGVLSYNGGHMSHEGYGTGNASSHYVYFDGSTSTGWQRIANNVNELEHSADYSHVYLYAGGIIDFASKPTTSISINAARIELTNDGYPPGFGSLFDYYPWERFMNGEFYSLNRNYGPSVQQEIGLFRMVDGKWKPVGNDSNTRADGQRYNNGWQRSPKSGKDAK